jgi:hypothetical protein
VCIRDGEKKTRGGYKKKRVRIDRFVSVTDHCKKIGERIRVLWCRWVNGLASENKQQSKIQKGGSVVSGDHAYCQRLAGERCLWLTQVRADYEEKKKEKKKKEKRKWRRK